MAGIFNNLIFNTGIFNTDAGAVISEVVKTGTGGIDPEEVRRYTIKPIRTLHLPKKEGRKDVEERIDESRGIQAEIAGRLAREFTEETAEIERQASIARMSAVQVEFEIGALLRKKLRTEEEDVMLMLLMVAVAA